jgi:predicted transcriptional regulator
VTASDSCYNHVMSIAEADRLQQSVKEAVRALVEKLPDDCTLEDVKYHLYVLENIRKGMEDVARGELVSQEEAKRRMAKWLSE